MGTPDTTYKTWSKRRREEALTEARERRLADHRAGVLSLAHGAGLPE